MFSRPEDFLADHDIRLDAYGEGSHSSTCPRCSHSRKPGHRKTKCLEVKIDAKGVCWCCHHCNWSGPEKRAGKNGKGDNIAATYDYRDADGELVFQKVRKLHCRAGEGRFLVRSPDGNGGWIYKKRGESVLYRLPDVKEAIASGHTILIAEGEKDVDNLWRIKLPATCNFDGAAETGRKPKWRWEYSEALRDADVVVLNDNDPPATLTPTQS
jgi:hypothetical protein